MTLLEFKRKEMNLSQPDLARKTWTTRKTIYRLEKGITTPETLLPAISVHLERFFGYSIHDLLQPVIIQNGLAASERGET